MPAHPERVRAVSLPNGYQFGDAAPRAHLHVFNAVSGYCACGLQYLPHLRPSFAHGGRVGRAPAPWMDDTRPRFVTVLPPGAAIETAMRVVHAPGPLDKVSLTYPCSCGGRWHMGVREPFHVDKATEPQETAPSGWRSWREYWTDRDPGDDTPRTGVYSGQGDEA